MLPLARCGWAAIVPPTPATITPSPALGAYVVALLVSLAGADAAAQANADPAAAVVAARGRRAGTVRGGAGDKVGLRRLVRGHARPGADVTLPRAGTAPCRELVTGAGCRRDPKRVGRVDLPAAVSSAID